MPLAAVPFLVMTACATLAVDKARLARIHKVAVVGFNVDQEMPPEMELKFGRDAEPHAKISTMRESEHANEIYSELARRLKKELKWSVADRKSLANTVAYVAVYNGATQGWQNRPMLAHNVTCFGAGGIADSWPIERMSPEERLALMRALNVDALATARITIHLENAGGLKKLVGAGEFKPQATMSFQVYDRATPGEAVWKDLWAVGETVDQGVSHILGITDVNKVNKLAVTAAERSFDKLVSNVKSL